jgi:hypothetical protein
MGGCAEERPTGGSRAEHRNRVWRGGELAGGATGCRVECKVLRIGVNWRGARNNFATSAHILRNLAKPVNAKMDI